jgi:hypothetical protein
MNEIPRSDATLRKELADEAKELLDNRAFKTAILVLRQTWFAQLMASKVKTEQDELVAMLKALESIPQRLESLILDERMAQKRRA